MIALVLKARRISVPLTQSPQRKLSMPSTSGADGDWDMLSVLSERVFD